jgi:uncharacterized phage-associated protein
VPEIAFRFSLEKLINALAYFSDANVSHLTKLKAAKLLYFADKTHLLRHGRPILGDVYFCLPYGPVPSLALNEMNDAIAAPEVDDSDRNAFLDVVEVKKPEFGIHPVFQSRKRFDRNVFSQSELDVLHEVTNTFGGLSAGQLVTLTHEDPTWKVPNEGRNPDGRAAIPYELFFHGAPGSSQEILRLLQSEQEDARELDELFARS